MPAENESAGGPHAAEQKKQETTPAEEWGDRVETSRDIARGGQDHGDVPGATGDEPSDPRSGRQATSGHPKK